MRVAQDELRKQGVSEGNLRAAAAIMVGNASAESELIPSTSHDDNTGYGIYGARDDPRGRVAADFRRTQMLKWLKDNGYAKDSLVGQTRYMAIEARRRGGTGWRRLMEATSGNMLYSGKGSFEDAFEGPTVLNDRSSQIGRAYRSQGESTAGRSVAPAAPSGTPVLKPNMSRAEIDAWNEAHKPAGAPAASQYGILDPDAIRRSFKVPPLGHQSDQLTIRWP